MTIDPGTILDTVLGLLSGATTLATTILGSKNANLKYVNMVTTSVAAVDKAIDSFAYSSDGELNAARENMAILLLSKICPKFDDAQARQDIGAVLAVIHAHAQTLKSTTVAPTDVVSVPSGTSSPK
jgi:hypothetical protein